MTLELDPIEHSAAIEACLIALARMGIFDPLAINAVGVGLISYGLSVHERDYGPSCIPIVRRAVADAVLHLEPSQLQRNAA